MLNQLNLQLLWERRRVARLKFLFMMKNKLFNVDSRKYIQPRETRPLRANHNQVLEPYFCRVNAFRFSLFPRAIEEWNLLPESLVALEEPSVFEKKLFDVHFASEVV